MQILTVTEFVKTCDLALSDLAGITVEGEMDEYKVSGGKWVRFNLKDQDSSVHCFMSVWQLNTALEDGMTVRVTGTPKMTNKWGFSFNLTSVVPTGEGSLRRALELLKQKLLSEGIFSPERKRKLPRFPQHVALVTSREAAAYSDFIKVLQARQGGLTIYFLHTQVQGESAPAQIVQALTQANTDLINLDAIVLIRGGGSLEDLQSFNDERVVRAIAGSKYPVLVGVGHERDITLADLAADLRASTPSNAAELLVESRQQLVQEIQRYADRLKSAVLTQIERKKVIMKQLVLILHSEVRNLKQGLNQLVRILQTLSPQRVLARGYSITRLSDGKVLISPEQAKIGVKIVTQLKTGSINSTVG